MALRFPRINVHVLTVFLLVALPIFAIGAFLVIGSGQAQLRQAYGQQLAQVAEHTAAGLDAYIYRRIIDATLLARVPDVRAAAALGNQVPFDRPAVGRLGPMWMAPGTPPAKAGPHAINAAAQFFTEAASADPLFRDLVATDGYGRVVATVAPRSSYFVGDEAWWQEARADGRRGRTSVSDIIWDKRARAYLLEVATPIEPAGAEGVAGVLRMVLDARELLAMVADLQVGPSGNAFLLREDGSIVYSRWPSPSTPQFFAADLVREKLRAVREASQPVQLYLSARAPDGSGQTVGLARSQLGLSYSHLSWLVAVSAADAELFGPVRNTGWNLLFVLALTAVGVLGFTLWDSRRLAAQPQVMDPEMQLVKHPRVHWIEEEEPEELRDEEERKPVGVGM
jgi:hypothetical protein